MKILMVITSHDQLGHTGEPTGFWLDEFAAPYYVFKDAGAEVTLASPKGGQPPIDPKSDDPGHQTEAMTRFKKDVKTQQILARTEKVGGLEADSFDAVFYPGGHGPMWDLVSDENSIRLIEDFYASHKPVAAVCHGPAVLQKVTYNGQPIVQGKRVTGFTNSEEDAVHLTNVVPFLVEDELKRLGGHYEKAGDWVDFTVVDGHLITGQNPSSSGSAAKELLKLLQNQHSIQSGRTAVTSASR
ncbi:type 1 glutamine amidotransferase domain-containing protein [Mesorhizobium opportunistum]|uniref:type 1 glutamine amidotransferase domain-containing protein n=1 Tax=Mesorhizobium opportunistum TaxID=593909 RepID=UPI00333BFE8A